ncbi:MAG: alanine racemase [Clostridia bacterium]|nr:alanine racemase [Clostridia bacterium]
MAVENSRWIDLSAIRDNVRTLRGLVPARTGLMAVVKADAYGHGAVQVSRAALEAGASWLAVAHGREGVQLREAGIVAPVLILGAATPADCRLAARYGLTLTVCTPEHIRWAAASGGPVDCHLKLDTGMGRIGARDEGEVRAVLDALESCPDVRLTGCFTHFADADGDEMAFTRTQLRRFIALSGLLPEGILRHCANSAAIHRLMPEAAFDLVRMGISLYGYPPVPTDVPLRPAMRWIAPVTYVKTVAAGEPVSYGCTWRAERETRVATVACGYGDGYHRSASGKARALIRGHSVPVIGRICMDQMMLDVTEVPEAAAGDTVTLLGQDGDARIGAEELAAWSGTISYEVLLAATARVGRHWTGETP